MKIINAIVLVSLLTVTFSCDFSSPDSNDTRYYVYFDSLKLGIINYNSRVVNSEVNKLLTGSTPKRTDNDPIGQKQNLFQLMRMLEVFCENVDAKLDCYACIETYPAISEILVTTDSVGIPVNRIIDILTPEDDILRCVYVHGIHR